MRNELKAKRVLFGVTVQDAADLIGKSPASYSKKENGRVTFTPGEMALLAEKLQLNFDEFNRIFFDDELRLKG